MTIAVITRPKNRYEVRIINGLDTHIYFATDIDGETTVCDEAIENGDQELVLLIIEKYLN